MQGDSGGKGGQLHAHMGNLAEDISLVEKKIQSQLWTAVVVSCWSFFPMVKGVVSSYK